MNGKRLQKVRKDKGYTQISLAEALGVSKGSVAMWETGKRNPEFETMDKLLSLLDVSYDYLTGKSDEVGYNNPTEDDLKQIATWSLADDLYDTFKKMLSLDTYGQSAVYSIISEEFNRCREQKSLNDTSSYHIQVTVDKKSIEV